MNGMIFSIEEFSIYDGPGIRSTVFLKGCPLRCSWCHNPEGRNTYRELMKNPNGCIHCGSCLDKGGRLTEESIKKCPMNLIRMCGETVEPNELCVRLLKNEDMYSDGGGVTFSGGEPFAQPEGFAALAALLHEKGYEVASYSGYTFEQLFTGTTAQKQLLSQLDVLIDGPFLLSEKSLELNFRGSRNQRVLNVPESLRAGSPVPETSDRWLGEY